MRRFKCADMRKAVALLARCGCLAVLFGACDPGFTYRPAGWKAVDQQGGKWSTSAGPVDLETYGISGIVGSTYASPEYTVHNRSDRIVILERAELTTRTGRYFATLPSGGAIEARTVKPGTSQRITVFWEFPKAMPEVLGNSFQVALEFSLGQSGDQVRIKYERVPD
jgi:hypothetical protein